MNMKNIISKIGLDKLTHFFAGGFISAFVILLIVFSMTELEQKMYLASILGFVTSSCAAIIKEGFFDSKYEWKDIISTCLGALIISICNYFGVLFGILTK